MTYLFILLVSTSELSSSSTGSVVVVTTLSVTTESRCRNYLFVVSSYAVSSIPCGVACSAFQRPSCYEMRRIFIMTMIVHDLLLKLIDEEKVIRVKTDQRPMLHSLFG